MPRSTLTALGGAMIILAASLGAWPASAQVHHIVAFQYQPDVPESVRADNARRFLALKDQARRDGAPYIISITGGPAASREGFDRGLQYAFVVTFATPADRDFFVGPPYVAAMDPAHAALAVDVAPFLERDADGAITGLFVFDYEDAPAP